MIDISDLDKDQLAEYAQSVYKVVLDMRKPLESLRKEVTKLQEKGKTVAPPVLKVNPKATHIRNNDNNRWFPWTPELQVYLKNFTLCDENGQDVGADIV
jgi:hypothetical protein